MTQYENQPTQPDEIEEDEQESGDDDLDEDVAPPK